jgi:CheY-like chemotaxis protein
MKPPTFPAPHILLVDDNRDGLLVRRALLEELGYSVDVALSGEEGLSRYEADRSDIVVADYRMPRMSGVEFIQKIRKNDPNARIILLSGYVEALGLTQENTGADEVLTKSAKEAAYLLRSIRRLLHRASTRKPPAKQTAAKTPSRSRALGR